MKPGDVAVVALAAAVVAASWVIFWGPAAAGERAHIVVTGGESLDLSLAGDRDLEVEGLIGTSVIRIRDGRVRFVDSPCVARYCVHAGWLESAGDVAACLPNGVVVEVTGRRESYDALSF
ncbi:MAG: NusG domain II-containing protein [Gammaproteobacteria bacterium]